MTDLTLTWKREAPAGRLRRHVGWRLLDGKGNLVATVGWSYNGGKPTWQSRIFDPTWSRSADYASHKSTPGARRWVETVLDRESIGRFGVDDIAFQEA